MNQINLLILLTPQKIKPENTILEHAKIQAGTPQQLVLVPAGPGHRALKNL